MASRRQRSGTGTGSSSAEDAWLVAVAAAAEKDAGASAEFLGRYLHLLAAATVSRRRPGTRDREAIAALGRRAAEQGVPAHRIVDLYLSAAWRMWRELPALDRPANSATVRSAAEMVLRVVDDAVAAVVEGYQDVRRQMIRREESLRRELIDDLLRGDADVAVLVERAEPFGLDLGRPHRVILAASRRRITDPATAVAALERPVLNRFGDRDVLVASKDAQLVVLAPTAAPDAVRRPARGDVAELVHDQLSALPGSGLWRVAEGRPYPGAYGIARSYEEAREALALADRLDWEAPVVYARDLLVYRVLMRDQAAITDLVESVLSPLQQARGGAQPLLDTLQAYFTTGGVATETGRLLHLSVRAVTYRLGRIAALTGHDPADPADRFALHAAVLGARLLEWPGSQ